MASKEKNKKVIILGGYGNFGKRISENLSKQSNITLIVSGRSLAKAEHLVEALTQNAKAELNAQVLDIYDLELTEKLKTLAVDNVIHTCGPFQGQDYCVAQACINVGAHYIDLADGTEFVCGITELDEQAKKNNCFVISGASSVPGLSSTVIDHFQNEFKAIESIDISIAPGNQAERGEATVRAILSYTGHPFKSFKDGQWQNVFGWMNSEKKDIGSYVGKRWVANVDVPDLQLFPKRYKVTKRVSFKAGLELAFLHFGMQFMAYFSKIGLIKDWSKFTKLIVSASNWFIRLGTDKGGMLVTIKGQSKKNLNKKIKWQLHADNGIGPYIPTMSAIILARKLIDGGLHQYGAMPCLGMFNLSEFENYIEDFDITTNVVISEDKSVG